VVVVDERAVDAAVDPAPAGVGIWVMEEAAGPAAKLVVRPSESWLSAGDPAGSIRTVDARVVVMGKDHDVLTNATTVGDLLSAMGIRPDRDDRVHPSPGSPLHSGMTVRYTRVAFRTRDVQVPIPFTTHTAYSDRLDPGEVRITRAGVNGVLVETYRLRIVNGEVAGRVLVGRHVLHAAVAQERTVGRQGSSAGSQVGEATWYYAPGDGYTAAHPWLPFGTVVTVTNLANGKSVRVVINDRGPFGGRIIDLSPKAFDAITGNLSQGICQVRLSW
jgi:hypothetical protein